MGSSGHGRRVPGTSPRVGPRPVQAAPGLTGRAGNWDEPSLPPTRCSLLQLGNTVTLLSLARSSNRSLRDRVHPQINLERGNQRRKRGKGWALQRPPQLWQGAERDISERRFPGPNSPCQGATTSPILASPRDPDGFTSGILPEAGPVHGVGPALPGGITTCPQGGGSNTGPQAAPPSA